MATTKLLYKGDYTREFGGDKPRIWRVFRVFDKGQIIGQIAQEPPCYDKPFRAYNSDCIIGGDYIGQFKTRQEAIKALLHANLNS